MNRTFKTVAIVALCVVATAAATGIGAFLAMVQPGGSGTLATLTLPDGSQYMVTQRCNWSGEPYTVSFYMKPSGGRWGWCYIDHQANRWRNVALTYDNAANVVTVTERGQWQAALDRKTGVFARGDGMPRHDVDAPQSLREPEYAFR
jgi:hypothetical protein